MKAFFRSVLSCAFLALVCAASVAAESRVGKVTVSRLEQPDSAAGYNAGAAAAASKEDRPLAAQRAEFLKFAVNRVREMNANHILSRERMRIDKLPNGLYRALFHEIDANSLSYEVNRSQSRTAPFVAVLSYREQVLASSCTTPAECRQGPFLPVEVIPNRHIFVYSNGFWQ